jgi:hypothetical protein
MNLKISSYSIKEMNVKEKGLLCFVLQVVLLLLINEEQEAFSGNCDCGECISDYS